MTARTKAAKLAAKRGRPPRQNVLREPNGRPSRSGEQKEMDESETRSVVVQRRIRESNIVPFRKDGKRVTAEEQATDTRYGYTLGRLYLAGAITETQLEAGNLYCEAMARFYAFKGLPMPSPAAQNIFSVKGYGAEDGESRAEAAKKAQKKATEMQAVLLSVGNIDAGRRSSHAVKEAALLDNENALNWPPPMHLSLRQGLNKLATYFGLWEAKIG